MDMLKPEGNPDAVLTAEDYSTSGELKTKEADLALVVQSASTAEAFISNKQWGLLWRDADLLFQSPRPLSTFENTYVLEPNVQRFTVAKVCNAIVPQLYKGLFYDNPPMILRPRPGTSQEVVDGKTSLFSYLLDECNFRRETKWGLEQMALLGTGVWKWGKEYKTIQIRKRKAAQSVIPGVGGQSEAVVTDEAPKITVEDKIICTPFFEWRSLEKVLVDPHTPVGDIREADYVCDVRYMDWYQVEELKKSVTRDGKVMDGWEFPDDLMNIWLPPAAEDAAPRLRSEQQTFTTGLAHHAQDIQISVSPDHLLRKLEVLEYWDKRRKILVLNRKKVLFTGENEFKQIPFLSANWWNRPKAFYGMGLGLIVGQNQRVDQGTINAILKILSLGVNPIYLRARNANSPTQMLRSGLGRILTVDGEVDKAYKLLEMPKVPGEVWSALSESEKATESSSGADQMLVQGSTSGPRSSMGRTATGASTLAGASATRLDGPLDNFIEQVFKPFLYILDMIVFEYMSDREIMDILGKELGDAFRMDMQLFHDAKIEYEVLAGASLAAKRQMAQSLTLITQIFENPTIQQNLAEINGEYIDFKPILNMWMEASEWKNRADIIKPLTDEMKQRMKEKSEAAQQQSQLAVQTNLAQQKFQQKSQLEDQSNDNRIKRDLIREAFRKDSMSEAVAGEPSDTGLGVGPQVV
jgi:hypothetical protein